MTDDLFSSYRRVGFFGLGLTTRALMKRCGEKELILRSEKMLSAKERESLGRNIKILDGKSAFDPPYEDIMILSPSVRRDRPEFTEAEARGARLCFDSELFFERVRAPVLAVSGSDGKSTTASLAAAMLREAGVKVSLIGNIGKPFTDGLFEDAEIYVAELSSFTLFSHKVKCRRAVLTGIRENHLNWHLDMNEYREAKLSLLRAADETVISVDQTETEDMISSARALIVPDGYHIPQGRRANTILELRGDTVYINKKRLLSADEPLLVGYHNIRNIMSAAALVSEYVTAEDIRRAAIGFSPLRHRCEPIATVNGVDYINSSIDTTPERTATTLRSIGKRVILILAGRGKGLSYLPIREASRYISYYIAAGECASEVHSALLGYAPGECVGKLLDAVLVAASIAKTGDTVLLSPSATSFDEFSSFEERGDYFEELVKSIK